VAERISDAEHAVMEVLWREAPLAAADVAQRIDPARGWSERTVKTLLGRLLAKGALVHEEEGRRYLYRPAVARDDHAVTESRRLIDRLFGGRAAPLVAHLAASDGLSDEDLAELESLVRELRK
jgi:BlaI family transcriptional regulator, penicillinase repressor